MSATAGDELSAGPAGHRFLRGATLRTVGYTTSLLFGAIVTPFVTRHLGAVDWGRYVTVTSLLFIVAALSEGGLANLGVRELSNTQSKAESEEYVRCLLGLRVVLALGAAGAAVAFAALAGYPPVMLAGTAIGCVALILTSLQYTMAIVLTVRLRLGWLALTDFLAQMVIALVMLGLVLAGSSLLPFYAASGVAALVTLPITAVLASREMCLRPVLLPARWRELLSQSVVYAAATALGVVYYQVVMVATSLLSTPVQSGYFGLGFRVLSIVSSLPWLLVGGAFPILARAAHTDAARLRHALQRMFEGGLVLGGTLGLALALGAPFAVAVLGGSRYTGSVLTLRILGISVPGTFLVATWGFALLSLERYRELMVVNGLAVLLAVALSLAVIPPLGSEGAAIVTCSLEVALSSGYLTVLGRLRPDLRPALGVLPRVALAFGGALALGASLPLPSLPATAAALALLAALLWALRLLPSDLIAALTHRQPRGGESD